MSTETALVRVRGANFAANASARAAAKGLTRPGGDWGDPDTTFDLPFVNESTLTPGGAAVVPSATPVGAFLAYIENGHTERTFARELLGIPAHGVAYSNANPPADVGDGTYAFVRVEFQYPDDAIVPTLGGTRVPLIANLSLIELRAATVLAEVDTDELVTLADWSNPLYPWASPAWV